MGVKLQSSSGGSVEIAAPVTASNYVLTAPAANGIILNDQSSLAAAMLTGNVDVARLVSAFSGSNVSLVANGYQKLPSGLIIQWGYTGITSGVDGRSYSITYPIAFPASARTVLAQTMNPGNTSNYSGAITTSLTGFTGWVYDRAGVGAVNCGVYYLAIGH